MSLWGPWFNLSCYIFRETEGGYEQPLSIGFSSSNGGASKPENDYCEISY